MTARLGRPARGSRARLGLLTAALGMLVLGLGGCVSQDQYDNADQTARALQERNVDLQAQVESLEATNEALQARLAAADRSVGELQSANSGLRAQLDSTRSDLGSLERRLSEIKFGPVDSATDRALSDLAARFPQMIQYDQALGLLRFTSDLTFASGSAQVTDDARRTLGIVADILTKSGSQYDVRILGHTDSQRISAGTAQRHPTNLHLSAHRAIAVAQVLHDLGVSPQRTEVAGRGEWDPLVPNSPSGNTPQNRRVEIYFVSSLGRSSDAPVPAAGATSTGGSTPSLRRDEPMK